MNADKETSKEYQDALDDRRTALAFWRCVAQGKMHGEVGEWLQEIAMRVLAADDEYSKNPKKRAEALMRAIGLAGKLDQHHALREKINSPEYLFQDLGTGKKISKAEILIAAESVKKGYADMDKKALRSLVDRQREPKRKKRVEVKDQDDEPII